MARQQYYNYITFCDVEDLNTLQDELIALNITIENIIQMDNDLHVRSINELSESEKTLVDNTIANFQDTDLSLKIPKIYDLVQGEARHKHFHNIDYKKELVRSLIPKRTVVQGEVTKVDWYSTLDENMALNDLILTVEVNYNRDSSGFASFRSTDRKWINRDGSINEEIKTTQKYYFVNPSDMITEGYKRRKLLVQSIQIPTLTFMTQALLPEGYQEQSILLQGRAFMDDYEEDFNKFVENSSTITNPADPNFGKKSIIVQLEDNSPTGRNKDYNLWLDKAPAGLGGLVTIRQYLINEFSI